MNQFSSQACESLHQWIKTFAQKFSNKKEWVRTVAVSTVVRQRVEQDQGPAVRSQKKRFRTATGHMSKAKLQKHEESKDKVMMVKQEQVEAAKATPASKKGKKQKNHQGSKKGGKK